MARFVTFSACVWQIIVSKPVSRRTSKSEVVRVEAHRLLRSEYEEFPELTDEMLARATPTREAVRALPIHGNSSLCGYRPKSSPGSELPVQVGKLVWPSV